MSSNNDTTVTFTAQQYQMILTLGNAANAAIQLAESQGQPRIGISNDPSGPSLPTTCCA